MGLGRLALLAPGRHVIGAGRFNAGILAALLATSCALLVTSCGGSHRHGPAAHPDDWHHLYVEVFASGSHDDELSDGANAGLRKVGFVVPVDSGGDVELQVELARLDDRGGQTLCSLKILILRLPQHDLLGIADGSATARGTGDSAEASCIEQLGTTLVRGKVRQLLQRRLAAKR